MAEGISGELRKAAESALETEAGCKPGRATALVKAVETAASNEAIEVIAGRAQIFGSAVDRRVAFLARVIEALDAKLRMPTNYEIGVVFQITPTQGRNVLRTYQARHAKSYRSHLQARVEEVKAKEQTRNKVKVFMFDYNDPAVLEFAVEQLRRRGLVRSVLVDRIQLDLIVAQSETDRRGDDAKKILNPPKKATASP